MQVKVGVVGCGRIATSVHMPLLKKISGYDLVAASDVSAARLEEVRKEFRLDETYDDYQQMLLKADIDAVFVCTPPGHHSQIAVDSIKEGKHVFCEKPLALTVDEGLNIKKAYEAQREAEADSLLLMPGHNFMFTPCFTEALRLVERGEIGKVRRIDACAATNLQFYRAKTDFRNQAKSGVIEDQLPHLIYLVHRLGGPLERVSCVEPQLKGGMVGSVNVDLSLAQSVEAKLTAKWTGLLPTLRLNLVGENGEIRMDLLRTPYNVTVTRNGESKTTVLGRGLRQYIDVLRSKHPSYINEQVHFLNCVQDRVQPEVSMDDGVELVRTLSQVTECFQGDACTLSPENDTIAVLRVQNNDVETAAQKSIDLLGGLKIKKDGLVVIKPNVCFPSNPENMVITDPRLLEAVLNIVKKKSRNILVVESDARSGLAEKRLTNTGIMDVIQKCGVEFLNLSKDDTEEHEVAGLPIQIPKTVLRADYLINLPKVKTNTFAVVSVAMKNMFGVIATRKKTQFHSNLADVLIYLNHAIRQDLIIADGVVAMEGLGPIRGKKVDLGLLISGRNPVTIDAACCHIAGFNPYGVEALWKAHRRAMGEIDPQRIRFIGDPLQNVRTKLSLPLISRHNLIEALKTEYRIRFRK